MMARRRRNPLRSVRRLLVLCTTAWLAAPLSGSGGQAEQSQPLPRYELAAEIRLRAEARNGAGENAAREDGFAISRLRLDMTFRPHKDVTIFLQPQDSRVAGLAPWRNPRSARDTLDFRQAYAAFGSESGPWTLYVGRREQGFEDQRLLGQRNWHNISPTWDGSSLTLRRGEDELNLLACSQVEVLDGFNAPSRTRFVYGAYGSIKSWLPGHEVEPFFLTTRRPVVRTSKLGGLLRTAGSRISGSWGQGWDYQVMLAAQGGGEGASPHRAWAGAWGIRRALDKAPARPRIGVEWSYASGDGDPFDGRTGTFDTLFPSPHRIYGEQDIIGLRNARILKAGVELRPRKELSVAVDFLDLRLASRRDGLYRINFTQGIAAPPGGAASDSIGSELDLVVLYRPASKIQLRFGVSRFFAGPFVTRNLPGGESQTMLLTELLIRL